MKNSQRLPAQKSHRSRRGLLALVLSFSVCLDALVGCMANAAPSAPQNADQSGQGQSGQGGGQPSRRVKTWQEMTDGMSDAEKDSAAKFLGYIFLHGRIAGLSSSCDVQMPIIIRECIAELISRWPTVSGLGDFGTEHKQEILAAGDFTWQKAYNQAAQERNAVAQPMPCGELLGHVKQAPIFSICHPISSTSPAGPNPAAPNPGGALPPIGVARPLAPRAPYGGMGGPVSGGAGGSAGGSAYGPPSAAAPGQPMPSSPGDGAPADATPPPSGGAIRIQ